MQRVLIIITTPYYMHTMYMVLMEHYLLEIPDVVGAFRWDGGLAAVLVGVLQFGLLNGSCEESNSWDIESRGEGQYRI